MSQVLVDGHINTYLIKGLSPASEYEVLLAAIYNNEAESDEVILVESTSKSPLLPLVFAAFFVLCLLCQVLCLSLS